MCHRPENDQKASRHKSNESHHRKSDDNTRFGQSSKEKSDEDSILEKDESLLFLYAFKGSKW